MDNALSAGVTGVGLAIPTGSFWLTTSFLIPNIAFLTGATPERALKTQRKQTHFITDEGARQCLYITIIAVELRQWGRWTYFLSQLCLQYMAEHSVFITQHFFLSLTLLFVTLYCHSSASGGNFGTWYVKCMQIAVCYYISSIFP